MELLIFSDSHGRCEGMQKALSRQLRPPQAVCFLGDGLRDTESLRLERTMLYTVRGNCDWGMQTDVPTERTAVLEGHRLLLTHGHLYGVKGGVGALIAYAAKTASDIVLFGHTHMPYNTVIPAWERVGDVTLSRPMYLFNPGSIGHNEDGKGYSFGTLLLTRDTVLLSHGRV
ncbi:MAG: metallophosphoesterase family protein [Clostridia bacterium]|nr:metallophosphoesterase family protein [Clostridia bacterium]